MDGWFWRRRQVFEVKNEKKNIGYLFNFSENKYAEERCSENIDIGIGNIDPTLVKT